MVLGTFPVLVGLDIRIDAAEHNDYYLPDEGYNVADDKCDDGTDGIGSKLFGIDGGNVTAQDGSTEDYKNERHQQCAEDNLSSYPPPAAVCVVQTAERERYLGECYHKCYGAAYEGNPRGKEGDDAQAQYGPPKFGTANPSLEIDNLCKGQLVSFDESHLGKFCVVFHNFMFFS